MKAVFSTGFKAELLDAETRYAEVSDRLAGEFRERIAGQACEIIRWKGGDHVGRTVSPAAEPSRFRFSSATKYATIRFTFWRSCMSDGILNF